MKERISIKSPEISDPHPFEEQPKACIPPKVWVEHTPFTDEDKEKKQPLLPSDANARKAIPVASGFLDYFPAAIAAVAEVSKKGNDQHNPGEPIHWARGKSMDQDDTIIRHFLERGGFDTDGQRHSAKMAWRALALLQLELEAAGAPMARAAR